MAETLEGVRTRVAAKGSRLRPEAPRWHKSHELHFKGNEFGALECMI